MATKHSADKYAALCKPICHDSRNCGICIFVGKPHTGLWTNGGGNTFSRIEWTNWVFRHEWARWRINRNVFVSKGSASRIWLEPLATAYLPNGLQISHLVSVGTVIGSMLWYCSDPFFYFPFSLELKRGQGLISHTLTSAISSTRKGHLQTISLPFRWFSVLQLY